jgi:urease accessory protein
LRTEIRVESEASVGEAGGLLALDNVLIRPPLDDVTGLAFMEGFSHLGSLIVVDPRVDQALADELHEITAGLGAHTGISLTTAVLGTAGLVLRSLSNSTEELRRVLGAATALVRKRWYGQDPLDLRKY